MEKDLLSKLDKLADLMGARENEPFLFEEKTKGEVRDLAIYVKMRQDSRLFIDDLTSQIEELKKEIEPLILEEARTINAEGIQAVYSAPSYKWNDDALLGYAATHPELLQFRTQGKPKVSFKLKR